MGRHTHAHRHSKAARPTNTCTTLARRPPLHFAASGVPALHTAVVATLFALTLIKGKRKGFPQEVTFFLARLGAGRRCRAHAEHHLVRLDSRETSCAHTRTYNAHTHAHMTIHRDCFTPPPARAIMVAFPRSPPRCHAHFVSAQRHGTQTARAACAASSLFRNKIENTETGQSVHRAGAYTVPSHVAPSIAVRVPPSHAMYESIVWPWGRAMWAIFEQV